MLAVALLVGLLVAIWTTWRRPFRALGLLVAGIAIHNFVLMLLISSSTPPLLIRAVQAWKEVLLAVLLIGAVFIVRGASRTPRLVFLDWVAIAFSALVIGYAALQLAFGFGEATLSQRVVSVRLSILMPMLYLFGRCFMPRNAGDLSFSRSAILLAAAVVGIFGLWELWLVPTEQWVAWGAVDFSRWLGFDYQGPRGLPANFFQTTGSGYLLRRMVSTYLSPLGIAYTGLVVLPLAGLYAMSPKPRIPSWPSWAAWLVFATILAAVVFALTRLALACLLVEFVALAFMLRSRVAVALSAVVFGLVLLAFFLYPSVGPLLDQQLREVSSPTRFLRDAAADQGPTVSPIPSLDPVDGVGSVVSEDDPSFRAHFDALVFGVGYITTHPLGTGPGSAVPRYGSINGPAESALLRIGGELGLIGALLYAVLYGGITWTAYTTGARSHGWKRSLAIGTFVAGLGLFPVMLTSDVWGNFSVMFLFWWLAGLVVTIATESTGYGVATWSN